LQVLLSGWRIHEFGYVTPPDGNPGKGQNGGNEHTRRGNNDCRKQFAPIEKMEKKINRLHFFMKPLLIALLALTGFRTTPPRQLPQPGKISAMDRSPDTTRRPVFTLEDTIVSAMNLLTIRDTAATMADLSHVIGRGYGELFAFVNQNGLRPGKLMAFYYSYQPPFILDIAVQVGQRPGTLTGRIKLKEISAGNAVVAHYHGPYDQIGIAYTAIYDWLRQQNKSANGPPFEVYLNDPMSVKDPFDLRTDVYQLIR
jgi:effector-binding domain-containing protein